MNKTYTHTGLVSKEVDFGKRTQSKRDFRETNLTYYMGGVSSLSG
jgi:hypothetical protein